MQAILLIQIMKMKAVLHSFAMISCGPKKRIQQMAFVSCICAGIEILMTLSFLLFFKLLSHRA